jgi:hypothetical protein
MHDWSALGKAFDEPLHDGEGPGAAWRRLINDIRHPWTRHAASRNRYGWRDLLGLHAVTNVVVEMARAYPQGFAKAWMWQTLATVLLLAFMAWRAA